MSDEQRKIPEGNSHKIKEKTEVAIREPKPVKEIKKEKSFGKKTEEFFTPIINDVILPAAEDTFTDIINEIMSGIANGIVEAVTGRPSNIRSNVKIHRSRDGRIDYTAASRNASRRDRVRPGTDQSSVSETKRIKDLTVASRQDAQSVIMQLRNYIDEYGHVTINDMYGLEEIGLSCPYTYQNFGWYNLDEAAIIKNPDGSYSFDLPKAVKIEN
jgi:hypothetical protein